MAKKLIVEPPGDTENVPGVTGADGKMPSFEAAYRELEEIVAQLERGDLPLERALELHERGQALAAYCATQLDQAELRVKMLDINQDE